MFESHLRKSSIKEGKTTLEATYDGITGRINVEVFDNPVTSIKLKSNLNELRTGDVVQFEAKAYDKRGKEVSEDIFLGKHSYVWLQALNRVHVQKSILLYCFGKLR